MNLKSVDVPSPFKIKRYIWSDLGGEREPCDRYVFFFLILLLLLLLFFLLLFLVLLLVLVGDALVGSCIE